MFFVNWKHIKNAVLTLQSGMTAAELTHLQGRPPNTDLAELYAKHMNQTKKRQVQKTVNGQQCFQEEQ